MASHLVVWFLLTLSFFVQAALPLWTAPPGPKEPAWRVGGGLFRRSRDAVQYARELERRGKYKSAGKLYRRLANSAKDPRNRCWAWIRAGDCFLEAGKPYSAKVAYEKVASDYMLYAPAAHVAAQMRRLAGMFARGEGTLFHHKSYSAATELYEKILEIAPAGANAVRDMLQLAYYQRKAGNWDDAAATCRDLLRRYPKTSEARIELASILLRLARRGDGDGRLRREAAHHLRLYLQTAPNGEQAAIARDMLTLVHESLGRDLIDLAEFYSREPHRRLEASRRYLYDVIRTYPETASAAIAKAMVARIDIELAAHPQPPPKPAPGRLPSPPPAAAPGAASAVAEHGPAPVVPPPKEWTWAALPKPGARPKPKPPKPGEAIKWLEHHEQVQKYLLPLEDIRAGQPAGRHD